MSSLNIVEIRGLINSLKTKASVGGINLDIENIYEIIESDDEYLIQYQGLFTIKKDVLPTKLGCYNCSLFYAKDIKCNYGHKHLPKITCPDCKNNGLLEAIAKGLIK